VDFGKVEMDRVEGPRKNSFEYKANQPRTVYGFTPNEKANKKILAEKNKELNPSGVQKAHQMNNRNKELAKQIFDASKTGDTKSAVEAYHRFTASPDVRVYTALIKTFSKNIGYMGEVVQIYNDMQKQRITPSSVTFNRLMDCCILNEHLGRGFFFLKEMLRVTRNSKPNPAYLSVFYQLIQLCHKLYNPVRVLEVYQVMLDRKFFTLPPYDQEKYSKKHVPISLIKNALPKLSEAEQNEFWIAINEKIMVHFRSTLEEKKTEDVYEHMVLNDFDEALRQSESRALGFYEDTHYISALDSLSNNGQSFSQRVHAAYGENLSGAENALALPSELRRVLNPKFALKSTIHLQNPRMDSMIQQGIQTFMNAGAELFNEQVLNPSLMEDEMTDYLSPIQKEYVSNPANQEEIRAYAERFIRTSSVEDFEVIAEELSAKFKKMALIRANKINWIPVIIGIDGEPFYPSGIGMHELTKETVADAKEQYLNTINDVDAREQIAENMYDQILLRFYDPTSKSLIEGLAY